MENQTVLALQRRAKYMLLKVKSGYLIIHLGMTGQLSYRDHLKTDINEFDIHPITGLQRPVGQHSVDRHTHLLLHLENGDRVQFRDVRTFGKLYWAAESNLQAFPAFRKLGVEPLSIEFRADVFYKALKKRKK